MAIDGKKKAALLAEKSKKMQPPKKGKDGKNQMPPPHDEEDEDGEDSDHEHAKGGGEPDAEADAEIAEQQNERLEDGNGDDELMDFARDVDPDKVPEWAEDEDVWHRAKSAADTVQDPDDYNALVTHVYEALGGGIAGRGGGEDEGGGE